MTDIAGTVFDRFEVRKSKRGKAAFRAYLREYAETRGYTYAEERGSFGARNAVIGDPTTARVTYTAHYDTCARLPFPNFITPTNFGVYLLYQILLTLCILGIPFVALIAVGIVVGLLGAPIDLVAGIAGWIYYVLVFGFLALMLVGPANPHTANDNTSGVITLLEIMEALPAEARGDVAFIFFDLEEAGMIGSASYFKRHKRAMRDKLLINFDCVSDGDTVLLVVKKAAADAVPALEKAFAENDSLRVRIMTKGAFYPSDQSQYPRGVGVAALRSTKRGLLYMNRIHTKRDIIYKEENVAYLVEASVKLVGDMEG